MARPNAKETQCDLSPLMKSWTGATGPVYNAGGAQREIMRGMRLLDHGTLRTLMRYLLLPFLACILASCASSLDMSTERIAAPGPEWGIVIGSVLVRPTEASSAVEAAASDRATMYEFDVVQIQPGDPTGESAYAARYHVEAMAGQEKPFLTRLRPGQYLIKNFHRTGMTGTGGDLNLVFESQSGRVVYVGQVLVEVPPQLTQGKEYRFSVQDAHEATFSQLAPQHGNLTQQAVTAPMRLRPDESR